MKRAFALFLTLLLTVGSIACITTAPTASETAPTAAPTASPTAEPTVPPTTAPVPTETAPPPTEPVEVKEVEVETIRLRPGTVAEVTTPEEFAAAYKEIYEENSEINMIRLMDSMIVYKVTLREKGGNDPWMSGYDGTIVVRMPEGTCLDLNGCELRLRANQGYDDNGTGIPSNDLSIGTVVDSFGGGFLTFYTINEGQYINRAIELAERYPELVKVISISGPVVKVSDYSFTIPENVTLRFSGKDSSLPCKSITFLPGATIDVWQEDSAPVLNKCKEVIFQCRTKADHTRMGITRATSVVDVDTPAPDPIPEKYYVFEVEGESGSSGRVVEAPPVIDNPDVETAEAAVIRNFYMIVDKANGIQASTGFEFQIPKAPEALTKEQKQQVLIQTALAYYYHNPYVQYDGKTITESGIQRHMDSGTPEDAALDSEVYSVCSNYCYKVYWESFHYKILGYDYARTRTWAALPKDEQQIVVYQYRGIGGETDIEKALRESRAILEPGDIIVGANSDSGHAMLYIGDCFGDGIEYILHCYGTSHDSETGVESVEGHGSIYLQPVDECVYAPRKEGQNNAVPNYYLGVSDHNSLGFAVLRPLLDPALSDEPTPSAYSRLRYPGLDIKRDLDRYKYKSALTGEEVSVYLTITNHWDTGYRELPILECVPEGTTLVEGSVTDGALIQGNRIHWSVKIPAGQSITLTYKVRMDAHLGETVTFEYGFVDSIPTRETTLVIGGKGFNENQQAAIVQTARSLIGTYDPFADLQSVNDFYAKALGLNLGLPSTTQELLDLIAKGSDSTGLVKRTDPDPTFDRMIIPLHFAGRQVPLDGDNWSRTRDYWAAFYEPGDIFIGLFGANKYSVKGYANLDLFIYLGNAKVLHFKEKGYEVLSFGTTIARAIKYNVLIALRPTLAYEDFSAERAY
ncbi:MAG: PT domain-containing protein, partial [Lachnospiraceae bacterium]|nr:PT domain-containing protein [Lachnospiraceae bacterium]